MNWKSYNTKVKLKEGSSNNKDLLMLRLGMITPTLWRKAYITGISCSDLQPPEFIKVGCDDDLNVMRNYVQNSTFFVECPNQCKMANKPIYGSGTYSADSSLCKAGAHSNALKLIPRRGYVMLVNVVYEQFYKAMKNAGIKSEEKKLRTKGMAFIPSSHSVICPQTILDKVEQAKGSFIQRNSLIDLLLAKNNN